MPGSGEIGSELRDDLVNGEIFYSLKEARIVIEQWRERYNAIRPRVSLRYRPPAAQTLAPPMSHPDGTSAIMYSQSTWYKISVRLSPHWFGV